MTASVAHFVHKVLKQHTEPIVYSEVSESEDQLGTGSELDDEPELVEVSSGELLLGALLADVDDDNSGNEHASEACDGSGASSDGLLLSTLLDEVDDEIGVLKPGGVHGACM